MSWEDSQVAAEKGNSQNSQTADSLAAACRTSWTLEMVVDLVRMIWWTAMDQIAGKNDGAELVSPSLKSVRQDRRALVFCRLKVG